MPTFRQDLNTGRKVPLIKTDDIDDKTFKDFRQKLGETEAALSKVNGAVADAKSATQGANEATRNANDATQAAKTAASGITDAKDGAIAATKSANEATRSANEATRSANEATRSANEAALNASQNAALANEATAKANQATKEAADAAKKVNEATIKAPYVDSDGYFYRWNLETESYDKTDVNLTGKSFSIKRVFSSIEAMNKVSASVFENNDFILINTEDVEDEDNAKLYVVSTNDRGEKFYSYLVDMSGFRGFVGKTPQLIIGNVKTLPSGSIADVSIASSGTDASGNPIYTINLGIPKGDKMSLADLTEDEIKQLQKPASDAVSACNDATAKASKAASDANAATTQANAAANNAIAMAVEASKMSNKVVENEGARESAESVRATNEDQRLLNETARETAENSRVSAENTRKSAETDRINAEKARVAAESARTAAEQNRVTSENSRVSAEKKRESDASDAIEKVNQAAAYANDVAKHPTKVDSNGNWWKWNTETKQYEDTGIIARGGAMYPTFKHVGNKLYMLDYGSNVSERVVRQGNKLVFRI